MLILNERVTQEGKEQTLLKLKTKTATKIHFPEKAMASSINKKTQVQKFAQVTESEFEYCSFSVM